MWDCLTIEVIRSATLTNAEVLEMDDHIGTNGIDKRADFLVLNQDPLADIKNIGDVYQVVKAGK